MQEKILILNGSFSELTIIQKAKAMGYYVVTTGNMPNLIGHQYANQYIPADYSDKEQILSIVKKNGISKIISNANDFGVLTAAYVAEQMGWKGHDSYEHALLLHHKDKFKEYCAKKNIPSPKSVIFTDRYAALEYIKNCDYPVIVKANDLTGGKGIIKANTLKEAEFAVENAFTKSRDKHILVEPYLNGRQQSFGGFISNKKIIASFSNDCLSVVNPYLIQAETLPAKNIEAIRSQLEDVMLKIVNDLNLCDGIFCLQYIVCDEKPYIIEVMRRCFGNQFLTLASANTGFPWEEAYILAQTGQDTSGIVCREPERKYCGHFGIMASENGILKEYAISPEFEKHIFMKIDMLKPGDMIEDYMNQRIAYVYYEYDNAEKMRNESQHFQEMVSVEVDDCT